MESFDGTNCTGIFRKKYIKRYFYYITNEKEQTKDLQPTESWAEEGIGDAFFRNSESQSEDGCAKEDKERDGEIVDDEELIESMTE